MTEMVNLNDFIIKSLRNINCEIFMNEVITAIKEDNEFTMQLE